MNTGDLGTWAFTLTTYSSVGKTVGSLEETKDSGLGPGPLLTREFRVRPAVFFLFFFFLFYFVSLFWGRGRGFETGFPYSFGACPGSLCRRDWP